MKEEIVIADKWHVSREFAEEIKKWNVIFIAMKRKNMMKGEDVTEYYRSLSRRSLVVKIIPIFIFQFLSLMELYEVRFYI